MSSGFEATTSTYSIFQEVPVSAAVAVRDELRDFHTVSVDNKVVGSFILSTIKGLLGCNRTMSDIRARCKVVIGQSDYLRESCAECHSHALSDCAKDHSINHDYFGSLLQSVLGTSDSNLLNMVPTVIDRCANTYGKVLKRGISADGHIVPTLDSATDKYIREQILRESVVQVIVQRVGESHKSNWLARSQEGYLFAYSNKIEQYVLTSSQMSDLMSISSSKGYCLVGDIFKVSTTEWVDVIKRMEALGLFASQLLDSGISFRWWSLKDLSRFFENSELLKVCKILSDHLPFELNHRNKALKLQVCDSVQLIKIFPTEIISHSPAARFVFENFLDTARILCIIPLDLNLSGGSLIATRADHRFNETPSEIEYKCGDMILFNRGFRASDSSTNMVSLGLRPLNNATTYCLMAQFTSP